MNPVKKLLRLPAELAARFRVSRCPFRVISAQTLQKMAGDMPFTETVYTIQNKGDGSIAKFTWSSDLSGLPSVIEAMRDWEILHGGE